MAYNAKDFDAVNGGCRVDHSLRKGNTPRPQSYVGNYTFDIPGNLSRPSDDGAEHPGIAPKQGYRSELPRPSTGTSLMDGAYDTPDSAPTQAQISKKHQ